MKEFIAALLLILGLVGGGVIGYCMGTINMQESAVAQGVAKWQDIETDHINIRDPSRVHALEFRWLSQN